MQPDKQEVISKPDEQEDMTDEEWRLRVAMERMRNERQPIMQHQHSYQVRVSDRIVVRWCVNCGETHFIWNAGAEWSTHWQRVKDEI